MLSTGTETVASNSSGKHYEEDHIATDRFNPDRRGLLCGAHDSTCTALRAEPPYQSAESSAALLVFKDALFSSFSLQDNSIKPIDKITKYLNNFIYTSHNIIEIYPKLFCIL